MCSFVRVRVVGVCLKQLERHLGECGIGFQHRRGEFGGRFGDFWF